MTTTINASPTNGIVQTADGSGVMKLQSNGKTTNALAWVNFNGTGTVAIRSSYNVSSITDNGAGDYTVNFATALSDANYSISGSCLAVGATNVQNVVNIAGTESAATTYSTTQCRIVVGRASTGNPTDNAIVNVNVHGN